MSPVSQSRLASWAKLLFVGVGLLWADSRGALAVDSPAPNETAVWETYSKPDGKAYFAVKLLPQLTQPKAQPTDVVVLFDTSASQIGNYRAKALGALRSMLSQLSADDRVALVAVDVNAARLTSAFVPPSGAEISQAIAMLQRRVPLGSTDMHLALNEGLASWTDANEAGRTRCVTYIGDGFSTASLVSLDALQRSVGEYRDHRISFSSYTIGPRVNVQLLGALSNHTGGMLVPDDERASDRQVGNYLANFARAPVIWPTATRWPTALKNVYPREMPPLRFDRDSVLVGTFNPQAIDAGQPWPIELQAELAGKPVILNWNATPEQPLEENAYLAQVVDWTAISDGVALPTVGSNSLKEIRQWVNFGAQQLARLGERALAVGRTEEAAQLADAAEGLDPTNAEADLVREAAAKPRPAVSGDLRLTQATSIESPSNGEQADVATGDLLVDIDRQNRIVQGFLSAEVSDALVQANSTMSVDPEGASDQLKLLLDKVQATAELSAEVRAQLVQRIEGSLRAASRMSTIKTDQDLIQERAAAEIDAKERISRQLALDEQKLDQLMQRFNALMAEERHRDAEAVADLAEEMAPATPGLRNAELTSRMVGYTADINAMREAANKGVVDSLFGAELSHVPIADDPPIIYPDPAVWQMTSERRKKYKAVDLTEPGPNEAKILSALDDKTEVDFAEQPLSDVVDYLRQKHDIEIQLDKKALTDAGIGSEVPVTRSIKGVSLRSALKLLLGELDLTYVLRNEVLMITSKAEAENMLSNRVYPVADLTVPIPPPRNFNGMGGGGMGGGLLGMPGGGMYGSAGGMGMGGMGMGGMGGMNMGGGMGMGGGMNLGGGMGFF